MSTHGRRPPPRRGHRPGPQAHAGRGCVSIARPPGRTREPRPGIFPRPGSRAGAPPAMTLDLFCSDPRPWEGLRAKPGMEVQPLVLDVKQSFHSVPEASLGDPSAERGVKPGKGRGDKSRGEVAGGRGVEGRDGGLSRKEGGAERPAGEEKASTGPARRAEEGWSQDGPGAAVHSCTSPPPDPRDPVSAPTSSSQKVY